MPCGASPRFVRNVDPICRFPATFSVESKTRTYHRRVGSGRRTAGRRGRAGRDADGLPGDNRPSHPPRGIVHTCSERRQHPMQTYGGTKTDCDQRIIRRTTAALRSWLLARGLPLVCLWPGHALHEKGLQRQKMFRSTGQQPRTKSASRPAYKPLINR